MQQAKEIHADLQPHYEAFVAAADLFQLAIELTQDAAQLVGFGSVYNLDLSDALFRILGSVTSICLLIPSIEENDFIVLAFAKIYALQNGLAEPNFQK